MSIRIWIPGIQPIHKMLTRVFFPENILATTTRPSSTWRWWTRVARGRSFTRRPCNSSRSWTSASSGQSHHSDQREKEVTNAFVLIKIRKITFGRGWKSCLTGKKVIGQEGEKFTDNWRWLAGSLISWLEGRVVSVSSICYTKTTLISKSNTFLWTANLTNLNLLDLVTRLFPSFLF